MAPSVRLPPLNALRAFEASARHGSFRRASEELGVTQGAVAQQVRGLEADLGLKLFDRYPRGLVPTEPGERYAGQLARAFAIVTEATASLRPEPRRLTISVTPTFASKWLISRLPAFAEEHPGIELRILASEALASFRSDGVDVAVRQGRPPFGPGLQVDLLFEQELVVVGSPTLLGEQPAVLSVTDLERFTLLDDAHDYWPEFIEAVFGGPLPPRSRRVTFSQTSLAIDAAVAGQGLVVASWFLVEQEVAAGRLARAALPSLRGRQDAFVVTLRKPRHPAPTQALRSWLLAQNGQRQSN